MNLGTNSFAYIFNENKKIVVTKSRSFAIVN